jgi:hypothetical protein
MYDTIHFWLPSEEIGKRDFMDAVSPFLDRLTDHNPVDGTPFITGTKLGMKVFVNPQGISLKGSICKSYLGNNFNTLTRQDTQRAIENLSDSLKLPIQEAHLKRIDFADNFIVDQPPENYYTYLGYCQYYKRLTQPKSIYYENSNRTKLFYNKIAEGKIKRETLPSIWADSNVLRYELRYIRGLLKQFNIPRLQGKDLYTQAFYIGMLDRWIAEYQSINKLKEIRLNYDTMKQPKDFWEQLLSQKVNEIGQPNLLALVEELRAKNVFDHPEYYSLIKNDIKKKFKADSIEQTNELITELDKKILQVKDRYQ